MKNQLKVFYDGRCILCHREIMHYKRLDKDNLLQLIDISDSNFSASSYGLNQQDVNVHMHAKDLQEELFIGIDCFIEIWKRIPRYRFFIPIVNSKISRPIFDKAYDVFAKKIRPHLPKRKCDSEYCQI